MSASPARILVLGGSLHHRGGLEAFCERAAAAINAQHGCGWTAEWWPTDTAYLRPALAPGAARRLLALARARRRFDLVWLQWSALADLAFLHAARARGLPVMVTPHLGANARLQRVPALRALCRGLLERANRLALLFAEQEREVALPGGVPRSLIRSFLPALSLAQEPPLRAPGPWRLIHAGRLSEGKGTFRTVALAAALRTRGVDCAVRIVGRGEPATMARLRADIASAGLGGQVVLTEWLDPAALHRALGEADVLAHLSTLDSFPLIVLEALAAGALPVVGEMAGAASMVARFDGHVAPGSSAEAAADWLAAQSPADIRRRGRAAAARVRADYDWSACVAQAIAAADATLTGLPR